MNSKTYKTYTRHRENFNLTNCFTNYFTNYAWKMCAYITIKTLLISTYFAISAFGTVNDEPYFVDNLNNVSVAIGRDATFQCVVQNLKSNYQVAWFHKDKHTLLAVQDNVIFRNGRISVSNHAGTTFYLHIHDIREEDRGEYMCQINTSPMRSQVGYLQVFVPPRFVEQSTSSDTEVREDFSVSLRCNAIGFPAPEVKWRREDEQPINLHSSNEKGFSVINGEYLNITKVTRLHMGAYICIASNGVPPAVSKRIFLGVKFSPLVWTPNQLIGAPIGSDVTLECNLESYPPSEIHWSKPIGQEITSNDKYTTRIINNPNNPHKSETILIIKNLKASDFGKYTCLAKNALGEAEGTVRLYEISKSMSQPELYAFSTSKEINGRRKYIGTKSSVSFDDNISERGPNIPIYLTEVFGYEITSEHITIQSEESVQNNQAKSRASIINSSIINSCYLSIIVLISVNIFKVNF